MGRAGGQLACKDVLTEEKPFPSLDSGLLILGIAV